MNKIRFKHWLVIIFLGFLAIILTPRAQMMDEDDHDPEPHCSEAVVELASAPYLNGLPLIQENLEIVGDTVKVTVQTTFECEVVTPPSLPFSWHITGPNGQMTVNAANTLRPHFRPIVAGAYEIVLTYCPQTCKNVNVDDNIVDIPRLPSRFNFNVADELPLPPDTEPELNALAMTETPSGVDGDNKARKIKCGFPDWTSADTPQLVPVHPWLDQGSYRLLEGKVTVSKISGIDNELNHTSHDAVAEVIPDPMYAKLVVPAKDGIKKETMDIEWESDFFAGPMRPMPGDRISAFGFQTYDCHHNDEPFGILTEIHPAVLTAVHRKRPIKVPDGWQGLGTNIYVPGIITDIWANKNAGEMTSNCSRTGLHQESVLITNPNGQQKLVSGACIKSPHSLNRKFTFNVYLPPNPQKRMAASGVNVPPAPLYWNIERASAGAGPPQVQVVQSGGVTSLLVTVDLTGYSGENYSARIVAGWVQPSPDNWGLERWKVGISSIDILDDHDPFPYDDGDWVFWVGINNRDKEWTRLLDGGDVTGFHDFGGHPFETVSPISDDTVSPERSLGPHLLLFHPHLVDFPGLPLQDLNRSFMIHTSGYDAEFWDDATGVVNNIQNLGASAIPLGARREARGFSSSGDYILNYFYERLSSVPPNLSSAGKALASAYSLHPKQAKCRRISTTPCLLFPETSVVQAWHPIQARQHPGDAEMAWNNFPVFEPHETEELSLTGISTGELRNSLMKSRDIDPQGTEQFMVELREEFDAVRGTKMEREFAKSLPVLKASIPADLWVRHFGDIDPSRNRSWLWIWAIISIIIVFAACASFWFFKRNGARNA